MFLTIHRLDELNRLLTLRKVPHGTEATHVEHRVVVVGLGAGNGDRLLGEFDRVLEKFLGDLVVFGGGDAALVQRGDTSFDGGVGDGGARLRWW